MTAASSFRVDFVEGDELPHAPPDWRELGHLVEAARSRGFTEPQCEYLAACLGLAWAKGRRSPY
jgi:hypothetical protein